MEFRLAGRMVPETTDTINKSRVSGNNPIFSTPELLKTKGYRL